MSTIVENHRVNLSRTFNKYAVHLVAQESFDHSRGVYSEYKKKNKFAIEESLEEVKDIYRGKSSGTFDKDKTVLVDIFVKHLPDDLKGSWACRESVYGIKGLRGPELDLQKKCTTIVNRVNRMIAKLRNIIFPKPAVITEKDIDETDDGIEELKERYETTIKEKDLIIERICKEKDTEIERLRTNVIDLTNEFNAFKKREKPIASDEVEEKELKRKKIRSTVECSPAVQGSTVECSPVVQRSTLESSPVVQRSTVEGSARSSSINDLHLFYRFFNSKFIFFLVLTIDLSTVIKIFLGN